MRSTLLTTTIRDLRRNGTRTLLVVLAITVGVVGTGAVLTSYSIVDRELRASFVQSQPADAVLHVDGLDDLTLAAVRDRPDVAAAQPRREGLVRLLTADANAWVPLWLVALDDFDDQQVAVVSSDRGGWAPGPGEIVIERSSLDEVDLDIGDTLHVTAPGRDGDVTVVGLANDPGISPAWMTGVPVGYVSPAGARALLGSAAADRLLLRFTDDAGRAANRLAAEDVAAELRARGVAVARIDVPVPGVHPAEGVTSTTSMLLAAFGAMALVASAVLVATQTNARVKRQLRDIGLMKAVGASRWQVARVHLGGVVLMGASALAIGLPLAQLLGQGLSSFTLGLLNIDPASHAPSPWVVATEVVLALGVPVLAVLQPVFAAARRPARVLLRGDEGPRQVAGSRQRLRLAWLRSVDAVAVRNLWRGRSRAALTVLAVSVGGAAFIVALSTGSAWSRTVNAEFAGRRYDLAIQLDQPYSADAVTAALADVDDIELAETWFEATATIPITDGEGDRFRLLVPPPETEVVDPPVMAGRWLQPDDEHALVVTQNLDDPRVVVGDEVSLEVAGERSSWTVVGVVRSLSDGQTGAAYASEMPLGLPPAGTGAAHTNAALTNHVRLAGDADDLVADVDRALADAGIGVVRMDTAAEGREALDDHLYIITGLLLFMALLLAVVGGLGMAQTMSINVIERRREIGVLRAVGAPSMTVLRIVSVEGLGMGLLSWFLALGLSLPATLVVEARVGQTFLGAGLETAWSPIAAPIWLGVVLLTSFFASAVPALEATEDPVSTALAYE